MNNFSFIDYCFSYDTGVIGGANLFFKNDFPWITNEDKELIVSLAVIGAAVGSLLIGPISDKYGRKMTIMIADIIFTIGSVMVNK